jgi:2-amino-4-hydroxy-6-hydroxymethyldihydropteridine diphosphokinase
LTVVYLSLGSNLGDRERNLDRALRFLEEPRLRLRRRSQIRETEPVGVGSQPKYLNLIAEFDTGLFPLQLLRRCLSVENQLGRRRIGKWTPRTIDIDIIFYGFARMSTPELTIPHPRYRQRRFVLEPLRELVPSHRLPSFRQLLSCRQ